MYVFAVYIWNVHNWSILFTKQLILYKQIQFDTQNIYTFVQTIPIYRIGMEA